MFKTKLITLQPMQQDNSAKLNLKDQDSFFWPFDKSIETSSLASGLSFAITEQPHVLGLRAAKSLQTYIQEQDWQHNFGLSANAEGAVIGKMFGILVVRTRKDELGYLAAFSGKLGGKNHHKGFVPPIFDGLATDSFLNTGMENLAKISAEISDLKLTDLNQNQAQISALKDLRKSTSKSLQDRLFDQYHFLNKAGHSKSLLAAFNDTFSTKPPAGAGECAAPKLLQYAFSQHMEPLVLAEFWWGLSPKSTHWKHGQFYPPCQEKCAPILAHMLSE